MVKHIVFWNVKEDLDKEGVFEELKIRVEAMNGVVPGLISVELGRDFNNSDAAYHMALYAELENNNALVTYADHPAHLHVKEFVGAVTSARAVVDYEV
jgi:hypothetical protein